jgi:hypothetical protein
MGKNKVNKNLLSKIDDKVLGVADEPVVRKINIEMLKQQRDHVAARLEEIDELIAEAKKLGVE